MVNKRTNNRVTDIDLDGNNGNLKDRIKELTKKNKLLQDKCEYYFNKTNILSKIEPKTEIIHSTSPNINGNQISPYIEEIANLKIRNKELKVILEY